MVEEGRTSQRTCMNDVWTWTTERLTVGYRGGLDGGGQKGKKWDNFDRINKFFKRVL